MSPIVREQLSPQPFRQWCAWRLDPSGWDEPNSPPVEEAAVAQLAFELGLGDRRLRRWRSENKSLERIEVEETLHRADVGIWEVYPELTEAPSFTAHCRSCEEEVSVEVGHCAWCGVRIAGQVAGTTGKLKDRHFRALNKLHVDGGLTIRELGRRVYRRAGYASPKSAEVTIWRAFKRLGLPAVDRRVLYSLPDSRRCRGEKADGDLCGKPAMRGGAEFCWQHSEEHRHEAVQMASFAASIRKESAAA